VWHLYLRIALVLTACKTVVSEQSFIDVYETAVATILTSSKATLNIYEFEKIVLPCYKVFALILHHRVLSMNVLIILLQRWFQKEPNEFANFFECFDQTSTNFRILLMVKITGSAIG